MNLRKGVLGCLALFAGLALLGVGSCVGFMVWLNRPGDLLEPRVLLDGETRGYIEWNANLNDPGTRELVENLFELQRKMTEQGMSGAPGPLKTLARFNTRRNEKQMMELFPLRAAWTVRGQAGAEEHLFAISIQELGNRIKFVDWILGLTASRDDDVEVIEYRDERIYRFPGSDFVMFIRAPDLFFAGEIALAKDAVDRLADAADDRAAAQPSGLAGSLAGVDEANPFRGAILNEQGELTALLRSLVGEDALDPFRLMTLGCRFAGERAFECLVDLHPKTTQAQVQASRVDSAIQTAIKNSGLPLKAEIQHGEKLVRVTLRIDDLAKLITPAVFSGSRSRSGISIE